MISQVKNHNGTPTLILEGKPAFAGLMWGSAPSVDNYPLHECARYYGEAGIHLFAFDIGTQGTSPEWHLSQEGKRGCYDFSTFKTRLNHIIDADPQARFHLRIHLEMPAWWQELYPEECELLSDGRRACQSFASEVWRVQAKNFLHGLIEHIRQVGLFERVIAYQVGAGHTGEWVKGEGAMASVCGDFSKPMQNHFQNWLRQRYSNDLRAFQAAWTMPEIAFNTAEIPSAEMQLSTSYMTFRDPRREQCVIDYYRCLADLCADLIIDFCTTVKQATQGEALAGAFYGYLMELAWNAGFFGEGTESPYSTYQRSGHLGLRKVLDSPNVDFLVSPYSYGFRGIGGEGSSMLPSESVRLHGKLYIFEEDSRTHLTRHDHPNYGKTDTLPDSLSILKRNFAYTLTHAHGIWWLAGGGPSAPHIDLAQQPAFQPLLRRFQQLGEFALLLERKPSAEVAVILDDESFYYESLRNDLDLPLIFQQRLWGLPRMGAPFDTYLLQDLLDGRLPPYKLYIFLNAFYLDRNRRQALKEQIQYDGRTAVWIYASGYLQDDASLENMTDLTGFTFGMGGIPWGPLMHIVDFQHPITQRIPQDLFWGSNNRLGPVFHLADSEATILGNVVYSQGRCVPGFGLKVYPDWNSIYIAAPNIPAPVLRGIADFAGVHIYNDQGDVLYATSQLLAIHTTAGGERTIVLPSPVNVIYDLFEGSIISRNTNQFQVILPPASTALFFTGDSQLLAELIENENPPSPQ